MIDLMISSSELKGSLSRQEERDMMFSRLFGLTAVIYSGLIIKEDLLPQAGTPASTLQDYQTLVTELISLGERKFWIRESCWWSIMKAMSLLSNSAASFKKQALDWSLDRLFVQDPEWTPEKVGIWLKFQAIWGSKADTPLDPVFRGKHPLTTKNLSHLSKILKVNLSVLH
jgi:DNA polymerase phi